MEIVMTEQQDNVVYMSDFKKDKKNGTSSDAKKSKNKDKVKKQKDNIENAAQGDPMGLLFENPKELEQMIASLLFGEASESIFQGELSNDAISDKEKLFTKFEFMLECFNKMMEGFFNNNIDLKDDSPPYEILEYTKNKLISKYAKAFTDFSNVEFNNLKRITKDESDPEGLEELELQLNLNMLRVDLALHLDYRRKIKDNQALEKMRYMFASKSKKIIAGKKGLFTDSMEKNILEYQKNLKDFFDNLSKLHFFQPILKNDSIIGIIPTAIKEEYIETVNCIENMLEAFKEKDRFKLTQNFLKVLYFYYFVVEALYLFNDWFEEDYEEDEDEFDYDNL